MPAEYGAHAAADIDRLSGDDTRCAAIAFLRSLTAEVWLRRGTVAGYTASVRDLALSHRRPRI
jgi:hypothetical protein